MRFFSVFHVSAALLALLSVFASPEASAREPRLSPPVLHALQTATAQDRLPIIVTLSDPEEVIALAERHGKKQRGALVRELRERARLSQDPLLRLLRLRGIDEVQSLWLINGLAFGATPALIEELLSLEDVIDVYLNETVEPPAVMPSFTHPPAGWNIRRVDAPALWSLGLRGEGQVVAVIDSGVDLTHPLVGSLWRGGNNSWFDAFGELDQPADFADATSGLGHGTAVTSVLVAGQELGVAPGAQWIAARIFHPTLVTRDSLIMSALEWALDPDGNSTTDDAPQVVNGSWGLNAQNTCRPVYRPAIQALKAAGIGVVFAAGNSGPDPATSESPANYPESYAVGASDLNDGVADFSARGPSACNLAIYPDVVAPGVMITVANLGGGTTVASGTSFSTPNVAGIMALLMQAFPAASISEIEAALRGSATDLQVPGPDNVAGYGLVNALAAFNHLDFTPPPVLLSPADGALLAGTEVTLVWRQLPDRLGIPVSNRVLLATDAAFSSPVEFVAQQPPEDARPAVLWATGGGLLLAVGLFGFRRGLRGLWLAAGLALLLAACGGGGSSTARVDETFQRSLSISNLQSNTTYYWKVLAENTRGSEAESVVRTFRVP